MVNKKDVEDPQVAVILHNIRSSQNVGALFRTADAAGVGKLYLTGYTPTPLDRFKRPNSKIAKTALGAEQTIPWEVHTSATALVRALKGRGVSVVACEQSSNSISYTKWKPEFPVAIIFGNEVLGVSKPLLSLCDEVVEIPMCGMKESLNVSVAAGIFLFKVTEFLTEGRR